MDFSNGLTIRHYSKNGIQEVTNFTPQVNENKAITNDIELFEFLESKTGYEYGDLLSVITYNADMESGQEYVYMITENFMTVETTFIGAREWKVN